MLCYRPLSVETLAPCADIAACAPDPWAQGALRTALESPHRHCFVASECGKALGFACFSLIEGSATLELVAVAPPWRRRGVARGLLLHSLGRLYAAGAAGCTLEARASNLPALSLYESLGFKTLARRRGLYGHPPEDGVLMAGEMPEILFQRGTPP